MKNMANFYRWYDEPNFIGIKIEESYSKDLVNRAIKKVRTIQSLANLTGLSEGTIINYQKARSMNIRGLKIILDILNIKYNRINHKIRRIGWNIKKFDIKVNSNEMAIILSASLADGHISKSHFMYKNKNLELIKRVKECIKKLFGDVRINDRVDRNGTNYILCSSFVKRQLERLGSPCGKKLFQNPSVPKLIKMGTRKQKRLFIQQFFDDEGWAEKDNRLVACAQAAETTNTLPSKFKNKMKFGKHYSILKIHKKLRNKIIKPNLLLDIKYILLKNFKIETNLILKRLTKYKTRKGKKYVSANWCLSCSRKEEVKKFEKQIGFFSSNKQRILKEILKDKPIPEDINLLLLNSAIKFHKEKGYFRVKNIKNEVNLDGRILRRRLNVFVKKKILNNSKGKYSLRLKI